MGDNTRLPAPKRGIMKNPAKSRCKVLGIACSTTSCVFHSAYMRARWVIAVACPVRADSLPQTRRAERARQ